MIVNTIVEKNRDFSTIDKIHLKCDCIDGSVLNGVRQPILFSFVLDGNLVIEYFPNQKQFIMKK